MAETITPSSFLQRYNAVSGCIITIYRHQLDVFRSFSENKCLERRLRKDTVLSTLKYLCCDLKDMKYIVKKQKIWNFRYDEEKTIILRNFLNDLSKIIKLLDESDQHLDVKGMIDNVSTAEYVMSQSIIVLLEKISSASNEFINIDCKFLDIVNETAYAFQKFMLCTVTHLHFADSFGRYKELSEKVLLQLNETLTKFKDEIFVVEFSYYTRLSLKFLLKYLICTVNEMPNESSSNDIGELQFIIANYIKFYITTISKALNTKNPINKILDSFDELEDQHLTMLEEISNIVKSNSTDNEPDGIIYNVILFFTEIIQNMITIEEYGKGFRISNK